MSKIDIGLRDVCDRVEELEERLIRLDCALTDEQRLRHETEKTVRHLAGQITKLYGKLGRKR